MFRLVVTLPKRVKRVLPSTRWYIETMEAARYETREGLGGADRSADATRDTLRHLNAAVRVEAV
jgi:hypothetical protein